MTALTKFLIGLVAVLLLGWLHHGPLGNGQALIDRLERQAQAAVARQEVPGVTVRLGRDPLSRRATLAGPADQFQREGQGELPGLNEIVSNIEGVSGVDWANPPPAAPRGS